MTRNGLEGRRVLVVEDEFFLALDMEERLQAIGWVAAAGTPDQFASRILRDHRVYGEVVRARNIRAD